MRFVILLSLLAVPGATIAAAPEDFCPALKKIIAASTETPAFASIVKPDQLNRKMGTVIPAGMEMCRVQFAGAYQCYGPYKPVAEVTAEIAKLQAGIGTCLGVTGADPKSSIGLARKDFKVSPALTISTYIAGRDSAATRPIFLNVAVPK